MASRGDTLPCPRERKSFFFGGGGIWCYNETCRNAREGMSVESLLLAELSLLLAELSSDGNVVTITNT